VLLFLVFQTVLKNVKNFRESYVFHCLVIKVVCLATACLLYHICFSLSRTFLSFFKVFRALSISRNIPQMYDCQLCSSDLITLTCLFQVVKHFFNFFFSFRNLLKLFLFDKQLFPTAHLI
ncbi:hypothetical protein DW952_18910, partial [Ruminococcus sp. AM44-9AT]